MRVILTLGFWVMAISLFAQNNNLRPFSQINKSKQEGVLFKETNLFKRLGKSAPLANTAIKSELVDYQIIELQTEKLKAVSQKSTRSDKI